MSVIISGLPIIGNKLKVVYSGDSTLIKEYRIYSGISSNNFSLTYRGISPYYIVNNSDNYIKASIVLKTVPESSEDSNVVKVINKEDEDSYEEYKISVVGNGLSLRNVLNENTSTSKVVSDVRRVSQSIFIILSTSLAEIPMLDSLGSNLPYHLFKEITSESIESLRSTIIETLSSQEPRIHLTDVDIVYDGEHTLGCTIYYVITNTNIKSSYIYNVSVGD